MKVHNVRLGHANNSSSSHSIVFFPNAPEVSSGDAPSDARTVLPGREVTYHEGPPKAPGNRGVRRPSNDMRALVLNVLVGARARWGQLSIRDQQGLVKHLRAIADCIERSVGREAP